MRRILTCLLLLGASLAAQAKVGDLAPIPEAEHLFNSPYGSIGALRGKLVLYFWFLPERSDARKTARTMNRLAVKYRPEGFEVVGISHRELDRLESWVRVRKPRFIVAWEPSNLSMGAYNFQQWPVAALVNARGRVVYKGTPGRVGEGLIKKHLAGARGFGPDGPIRLALDLPKPLAKVSKALEQGHLSKAMKLSKEISGKSSDPEVEKGAAEVRKSVNGILTFKAEEFESAVRTKRYYEAVLFAERLETHAPESKQCTNVRTRLAQVMEEPGVAKEIRGGKLLWKARHSARLGNTKKARKALEKLTAGEWKGTQVALSAAEVLRRL